MAISPLQPVTAAVNNAANMSRTVNTSTVGRVDINNTTDSTSSSTGALHTTGGLGVEKKAYIGTDLSVGGAASVGGNVSATNLVASQNVVAQSVAADTVNAQAGTFALSLDTLNFTASNAFATALEADNVLINQDLTVSRDIFANQKLKVGTDLLFETLDNMQSGATVDLTGITAPFIRLTGMITSIDNIEAPMESKFLVLKNASGGPIDLLNGVGNIRTGTGTDFDWQDNQVLIFIYDVTSMLWYLASGAGSGTASGSGSGGSFKWYAPRGIGPITDEEFEQEIYLFSEVFSSGGMGQYLTGNMKMTNTFDGFTTGQGFLYFKVYTPSTSGRYKFELTTTLIKDGVDSFGSITNEHVTSTEIIISGPANLDTLITLAYTDATGMINGQSVDINDTLKFKLRRIAASTAEDTADIRFVPSGTEIYI